ncbi:hypothetical protein QUF90_04480 [Desulfococcaceae bacterium HSG9]|nr:hypothetical protein [Desulfococcaceae bacterium HSG9]
MKMKRSIIMFKVLSVCVMFVMAGAQAVSAAGPPVAASTGYVLFKDVEAGAGKITSSGYVMIGIAGEPSGSAVVSSAGYNLRPGYKIEAPAAPAPPSPSSSEGDTTGGAASVMYVTATGGTYSVGDVISIFVRLDQIAWVSGTPQIVLNIGETPVTAYYSTGSGTDTLTFQYTVAAGDMVTNLEYWSEWALQLNGGRIWDNLGNDVILDLPAPGTPGSLSGGVITPGLDTDFPVYRLYCHVTKKHLFTMDENEKDTLIALTDADGVAVWRDEGIAYYAFRQNQYKAASRQQKITLQAVHRFYSEALQTHLFTVDENEKETLIAEAADVWRYEGVAFYVPADYQEGTLPVYRFYSESLAVHLFTTDENEKNTLIETAGDVWRYEGIAYYAYP